MPRPGIRVGFIPGGSTDSVSDPVMVVAIKIMILTLLILMVVILAVVILMVVVLGGDPGCDNDNSDPDGLKVVFDNDHD